MKIVDCYIPIREINGRGLKSRYQEVFQEKPLLHHVIENLKKIATLRDIALICEYKSEFLEETSEKYSLRLHQSSLEDNPRRSRFRKARKWNSYQWRGGIDHTSFYDEDSWPHAFLAVMNAHPCDLVYQVGAEWMCLDSDLSNQLIQYGINIGTTVFTIFHQASPGFLGTLMNEHVLAQMASKNLSLRDAFAVNNTGTNNMDPVRGDGDFEVDPLLSGAGRRFIPDTQRLHRWLEALAKHADLKIGAASALDWVRASQETPFSDGLPEEVEWEWQGPQKDHTLSEELFYTISESLLQEQDTLITVDGRGHWVHHPEWQNFSKSLKEKKCHGLHLRIAAEQLEEEHLQRLFDSKADVVSFVFDDHFAKDKAVKLVKSFCQEKNDLTSPLVVVEMAREKHLISHWENFWDTWFGLADQIMWRPSKYSLEKPVDSGTLFLNRRTRHPCLKLEREFLIRWNGTIPLCRLDAQDHYALGQFPSLSFSGALSQIREKWWDHKNRVWETPCESCLAWDRLTP